MKKEDMPHQKVSVSEFDAGILKLLEVLLSSEREAEEKNGYWKKNF